MHAIDFLWVDDYAHNKAEKEEALRASRAGEKYEPKIIKRKIFVEYDFSEMWNQLFELLGCDPEGQQLEEADLDAVGQIQDAFEAYAKRGLDIAAKIPRDDKAPPELRSAFEEALPVKAGEISKGVSKKLPVWTVSLNGAEASKAFRNSFQEITGWRKPSEREALSDEQKAVRAAMKRCAVILTSNRSSAEEKEEALRLLKEMQAELLEEA